MLFFNVSSRAANITNCQKPGETEQLVCRRTTDLVQPQNILECMFPKWYCEDSDQLLFWEEKKKKKQNTNQTFELNYF